MTEGRQIVGISKCDIQLYDVDPLGIVWHGNYFRFFESARSALFQRFGFNFLSMEESGYRWPIVDFRVKYQASLVLNQSIITRAFLMEYENRLKIHYEIFDERGDGCVYTKATSIQVAVKIGETQAELESPGWLVERVERTMGIVSCQARSGEL